MVFWNLCQPWFECCSLFTHLLMSHTQPQHGARSLPPWPGLQCHWTRTWSWQWEDKHHDTVIAVVQLPWCHHFHEARKHTTRIRWKWPIDTIWSWSESVFYLLHTTNSSSVNDSDMPTHRLLWILPPFCPIVSSSFRTYMVTYSIPIHYFFLAPTGYG